MDLVIKIPYIFGELHWLKIFVIGFGKKVHIVSTYYVKTTNNCDWSKLLLFWKNNEKLRMRIVSLHQKFLVMNFLSAEAYLLTKDFSCQFIFSTAEQYSKLQKKRARNSVPKCPCKLLQPADRPMAGSSSLEGHFGTGLRARFSSAWSNVGCV